MRITAGNFEFDTNSFVGANGATSKVKDKVGMP